MPTLRRSVSPTHVGMNPAVCSVYGIPIDTDADKIARVHALEDPR